MALEEEGLELVLRDEERVAISLRGLSGQDIGVLAQGIEQKLGEEELMDPEVRARLAEMGIERAPP